jgi:hypothetical protein
MSSLSNSPLRLPPLQERFQADRYDLMEMRRRVPIGEGEDLPQIRADALNRSSPFEPYIGPNRFGSRLPAADKLAHGKTAPFPDLVLLQRENQIVDPD